MGYARAVELWSDDVEPVRSRSFVQELGAGLVAGQAGGLFMAVVVMVLDHIFADRSPFLPLQALATLVYGDAALRPWNGLAIGVGALLHILGPAVIWGLFFALIVRMAHPNRAASLLILGLLTGLLAQVVDIYIVLPAVFAHQHLANAWFANVHPAASWLAHIAFGVGLSLVPWKYDPLAGRYV
jgi:hypothetical protein